MLNKIAANQLKFLIDQRQDDILTVFYVQDEDVNSLSRL